MIEAKLTHVTRKIIADNAVSMIKGFANSSRKNESPVVSAEISSLLSNVNVELWQPRNLYPGDRRWEVVFNEHIFLK